jgi:hypothetical protein
VCILAHLQGVVKALFDNGLLPKVLSGSSVGSISASQSPLLYSAVVFDAPGLLLLLDPSWYDHQHIASCASPAHAVSAIIATRNDEELAALFQDMHDVSPCRMVQHLTLRS